MSNYSEDISEAPTGAVNDDSYVKRRGDDGPIDVVKDEAGVEDPVSAQDADSDRTTDTNVQSTQKAQDEKDAIDKSNIIDSRLRGNEPKPGAMAEPTDEEMGLTE
ncbi:hypothetical protein F4782DRAFT_546530 [Xylaria castorea]|nr:hypothetical protein F4782DRAFT_546530 [Xylaria castorea]